ncbi:MAG: tripartite tricarboxylate transporter TctB family protein [Kiloniellaceae bacterium]
MTRRDWSDIVAALVLGALGTYVFFESLTYGIGPATRMGSGNVPMMLGAILVVLALWIAVSAWRRSGRQVASSWRPLSCVAAAMACFCVLLPLAGFLPAMVCAITVCALADPQFSVKGTVALVVSVTFVSWLIFSVGLQIHLPMIRGL